MENTIERLNKISTELYDLIGTQFPDITLGDEQAQIVTDPADARFFDFTYKTNELELGKISVALNDKNITVIFKKDITAGKPVYAKESWYNFLRKIRKIANVNRLSFDVRDIDKNSLTKRDYQVLSGEKFKENSMSESKFYGTSQRSYLNIGEARLVIKHTQSINQEMPGSRSQHVESIYIESTQGERFKYPIKHLSGAKAMARHVSEGGNQYDDFGKYIVGLSEELASLGKFKRYMNRGGVMAESLAGYVDTVNERVSELKKTVEKLQRESFYKETFESFEQTILEEVPTDVAENWIDQLTIKQFNEELKGVFPYIYRLVSEATKAKMLSPGDLVAEADDPCWKDYKQIGMKKKGGREVPNCVPKEEIEIEAAFESMMGQFSEATPNNSSYSGMNDNELDVAYAMHKNQARISNLSNKKGQAYTHQLAMSEIDAERNRRGTTSESMMGQFGEAGEVSDKTTAGYITVRLGKKTAGGEEKKPYLVAYAGHVTEPKELTYDKAIAKASPITSGGQLRTFISRLLNSEKGEPHAVGKPPGVILALQQGESGGVGIINSFPFVSEIEDWIKTRNSKNVKIELFSKDETIDNKVVTKKPKSTAGGYDPQAVAPAEKTPTTYFSIKNPRLMDHLRQTNVKFMREYYRPNIKEFVMGQKEFNQFLKTVNGGEYKATFGDPGIEIDIERSFIESANLEEGLRDKLKILALIGMAGMGGNMALDSISAKNSPLGQALAVAAQNGDSQAAEHLKNLDAYIDGNDTGTLKMLNFQYMEEPESMQKEDAHGPDCNCQTDECSCGAGGDDQMQEPPKAKPSIGDFILSFYDRNTGNFPKGETSVLTMVEKEFGDQYVPFANEFITKVHGIREKFSGTQAYTESELTRIRNLAGM